MAKKERWEKLFEGDVGKDLREMFCGGTEDCENKCPRNKKMHEPCQPKDVCLIIAKRRVKCG